MSVAGRIEIDFEFRTCNANANALYERDAVIKQTWPVFTPDYADEKQALAAIKRVQRAVRQALVTQATVWRRKRRAQIAKAIRETRKSGGYDAAEHQTSLIDLDKDPHKQVRKACTSIRKLAKKRRG